MHSLTFIRRILVVALLSYPLAITAEVRVTTIVVTASIPTPTISPSYTSDSQFEADVINSTNTFRAQHNASPLEWNRSLAEYARRWAQTCKWEHSVCYHADTQRRSLLEIS